MDTKTGYLNLLPLTHFERIIVCSMIKDYLGIIIKSSKYKIPDYIKKLFKHYCIKRTGADTIFDPGYVSFSGINNNSKYSTNLFDNFRVYFFKDDEKTIICPNKVKTIFVNCQRFYDQDEIVDIEIWEVDE